MGIAAVSMAVGQFCEQVLGRLARVVAVEPEGEKGWKTIVEMVEESDYTRRLGKCDILGVYEVQLDENLEIVSFCRKCLKERTAVGVGV